MSQYVSWATYLAALMFRIFYTLNTFIDAGKNTSIVAAGATVFHASWNRSSRVRLIRDVVGG
jgi:hypothetical protein